MTPGELDFTAPQGCTFNPVLTYRDSSEALVNLTGYTARMHVRESFDAAGAVLSLTTENGGITLGGAAGTISLLVTAADMAAITVESGRVAYPSRPVRTLVYDLELVNGSVVTRLVQGKFIVSREVTHE